MAITRLGTYAQIKGSSLKLPCRVATTGAITLSGTQTIDGVAVVVGDRVLVKNQGTGSTNGIYVVAAGAWSRAVDMSLDDDVFQGLIVYVNLGTVNSNTTFVLTTANPITLGTTSLTFSLSITNPVTGTGTTNTLPKFTGASTIGNSNISDSGTAITLNSDTGIGTTSLGAATMLTIGGTETAVSAISRGQLINTTLVASANNDVLVGLDIAPTFTNGAFTGVNNIGLRLINTLNSTGADVIRASPLLQLSGSIWNNALGAVRILGGLQVTAFQQNSNPTISKLSFLISTDNALATEQMFITSAGLLGINGGANFNAGTGSFLNDITIAQTAAATSSVAVNSNRLVLKGRSWNSAQGNVSTMGYLQMINVVNNANPTTDKLSFFVGSANNTNNGNVAGNATERLAMRTDGIFSYFNLAGTEFLRLVGSTGNIIIQNGGTFTDAGFRLDVNGTARVQNKLSVGTPSAASAVMEVTSTTQGFLPPRMTTTQKNAIASPATGLVIFDTTLGKLCVFTGTWQTITSV